VVNGTNFRAFLNKYDKVFVHLDKEACLPRKKNTFGGVEGTPQGPEKIEKFITKLHVLYSTKVATYKLLFDRYGTDY